MVSGLSIKSKTDWLSSLMRIDQFFDPCSDHHQELSRNEKIFFCLDCCLDFCMHCAAHHQLHQSLRIFKYIYHNVVRVEDIKHRLDCSRIQSYIVNGEKAVHLKSRPQANDPKSSTTRKPKDATSCEVCERFLHHRPNRFCSIQCMVSSVDVKPEDQSNKMELHRQEELPDVSEDGHNLEVSTEEKQSTISSTDVSEETKTLEGTSLRPRKRDRKGIPCRAASCY